MPVKAKKAQTKKSEATVVTTLRITSISKVSSDNEEALDEIRAKQNKLLKSIRDMGEVDNLEVINERTFLNLK